MRIRDIGKNPPKVTVEPVEDVAARIAAYRADFPLYAEQCLKVRDKGAQVVPFILNTAQVYIHERIEQQRREFGYVRAMILKGRQQGASTYVEGRYYWKTTLFRNVSTYIMSHEQSSADAIFQMVDRYHRNNPLAPKTGTSNVKELSFPKLGSSYAVATAGSQATGRGRNTHLFHGSEVAFWKAAAEHFKASVQSVALLPGTEVILASTANGPQGEFWRRWQDAIGRIGDYIAIFVPWFWTPEYRRRCDANFELDSTPEDGDLSEVEYAEVYNLDNEQMCWRRYKIIELGSLAAFRQEYPAYADEAFQSAESGGLISSMAVLRARKRKVECTGPLIMGVDPAGDGADRFAIAFRRGHKCERILSRTKITEPEALAWVKALIDEHRPAAVFIDSGGLGRYLIGFLKADFDRYATIVHAVNFGSTSQAKLAYPKRAGPKNRRAEMWERLKRWLESDDGVQIPDDDALHGDLISTQIKPELNNNLLLMSKQEMRSKGLRSPDLADALALTFADTVYVPEWSEKRPTQDIASPDDFVVRSSGEDYSSGDMEAGRNSWMGL